jgi:CheY-like chemotaxis protein
MDPRSVSVSPTGSQIDKQETTVSLLLVEDSETDVFIIREVLDKAGLRYKLQLASDGEEALRLLLDETKGCPDIVVLDLNIPKISGFEVLRKVRASERCRNVPVLVVTSSSSNADRRATSELGATAYFTKPTSLDEYYQLGRVLRDMIQPKPQ